LGRFNRKRKPLLSYLKVCKNIIYQELPTFGCQEPPLWHKFFD
jgi:hypothetical protein